MSPCRSDHIFIGERPMSGIWPLRILVPPDDALVRYPSASNLSLVQRSREAGSAIDEASEVSIQPFLLIVRTARIFTGRHHTLTLRRGCDNDRVPADSRSFQHIAEFIDSAFVPLSHDVLNPARVPL